MILAILLKGVWVCKEALRSAGNTTEGLTFCIGEEASCNTYHLGVTFPIALLLLQ